MVQQLGKASVSAFLHHHICGTLTTSCLSASTEFGTDHKPEVASFPSFPIFEDSKQNGCSEMTVAELAEHSYSPIIHYYTDKELM